MFLSRGVSELQHCKAMSYFRNAAWKEDLQLKEDLQKSVGQLFKGEEILSFVIRDYCCYTWSVRSLDRRVRHCGIFCNDKEVTVDDEWQAIAEEMDGPGKLLGYRAMQKKIRQEHELNVPRGFVHAVMYDMDPEGLEGRNVGAHLKKWVALDEMGQFWRTVSHLIKSITIGEMGHSL